MRVHVYVCVYMFCVIGNMRVRMLHAQEKLSDNEMAQAMCVEHVPFLTILVGRNYLLG